MSAAARTLLLVGIGVGDPDQLTLQAVAALRRARVVFMIDKGEGPAGLVRLRREILERHLEPGSYRVVEIADPERDRTTDAYRPAVEDWHRRRAALYERMLADELDDGGTGAIMVWGDPSLYDSTLRVVDRVRERAAFPLDVEVIPGITSPQALAAAHGIPLNRIGGPIQITTGRRLARGLPEEADDVVVMLDGRAAFTDVDPAGLEIWWGAYLGTPDEILLAGPLADVADEIARVRTEARERHGWIMDTYLLRRRSPEA